MANYLWMVRQTTSRDWPVMAFSRKWECRAWLLRRKNPDVYEVMRVRADPGPGAKVTDSDHTIIPLDDLL